MTETLNKSTRDAYGPALVELAALYDDLVVIDGDVGAPAFKDAARNLRSNRYFNMGIAEQNMILTSAGLSLANFRVFVSSLASFLVGRAYDEIRETIAIPGLPVKLIASYGGVTVGEDGATHQMLEDIALMRVLPGMGVLVPSDYNSAFALIKGAAELNRPVYIRLGRPELPLLYDNDDANFSLGGGRVLKEGTEVTICACGIMVHEALKAAKILAQQDLCAEVIDCYSVNPLPAQQILESIHRTGCCVVAEEHLLHGGLGDAIASLVCRSYPAPVKFVAVDNKFGQSGRAEELQEYYGLTSSQIVSAAVQVWTMRRR
ncbi:MULTISPECIES: transketolase family protein [Aminobacterium]|jgi:transketolase|uniref:Transketolase central region n=1 Tax=Aminobacterium colombiense (strain DSM 12261 / ALA-1) TaxID=572547 RepID=D5EG95_AMICL|nr:MULTISPECIES: transketolase C-terminal domain-containing protein [Aminobacterium]MDD2379649.1 transketolase C-terminal domain-containing protein [Aminobacterium colombiense]ADE57577.1 Transketolase central region [Aminobacterium colombiense DSM 12261]MDD3768520.1 transketolase C-terminal domain-containing protein [Aminobacterium colombiense]MDD4265655.1 transketolase C-terminal domain-containing protein [Aminobacterium colombiense]MDD4585877.1 transketolase C-terminal domain-containing prot